MPPVVNKSETYKQWANVALFKLQFVISNLLSRSNILNFLFDMIWLIQSSTKDKFA